VRVWARTTAEGPVRLLAGAGDASLPEEVPGSLGAGDLEAWIASSSTSPVVALPLVFEGATRGALAVVSESPLADSDRSWLAAIASSTAAAIAGSLENDEALAASEQLARGQLEVLTRTLDALALESAPDRVLEHILRTMTEHLGAHSTSVWRFEAATHSMVYDCAFEGTGLVTAIDPGLAGVNLRLSIGEYWPWRRVLETGRPTVLEDIREFDFSFRPRMLEMGIVSILVVPMLVAGRVEGVINIRFAKRRTCTTEEMDLAQALVNQATLVMELRRLSAYGMASAVVEERTRMARDIHDTLAQGFTGVIVQLEAATDASSRGLATEAHLHVQRAIRLARDSLTEARRSVKALRPRELDDAPLTVAMGTLARRMTEGTAVQCNVVVNGTPRELPPEWDANLLRVGQEVVTNMLRHSRARRFDVAFTFAEDALHLALSDDGVGFDTSVRHDGCGLLGIRERVERMGGSLAIRSGGGQGTAVSMTLPLRRESPS
jgi:signal transduction histidine kinase